MFCEINMEMKPMTLDDALIFATTTEAHLRLPANKEPLAIFLYKKIREIIRYKVTPKLYDRIDPFPKGLTSRTSQPSQGHAN